MNVSVPNQLPPALILLPQYKRNHRAFAQLQNVPYSCFCWGQSNVASFAPEHSPIRRRDTHSLLKRHINRAFAYKISYCHDNNHQNGSTVVENGHVLKMEKVNPPKQP